MRGPFGKLLFCAKESLDVANFSEQRGSVQRVWGTGNASAAARLPAAWSEPASTASWHVWMDATVPMVTCSAPKRLSCTLVSSYNVFRPSSGLIYEDGSCVMPSDCPCEYHGMFYSSGHTLQEECNNW